jgi:hypothetical protein
MEPSQTRLEQLLSCALLLDAGIAILLALGVAWEGCP